MPCFANKATFDDVRVIRATANALLVEIDGDEHWIPQSQIDDDSEVYADGHEGELVISEWLAQQKGLV
jgi:hypothetical protein